MKKYDYKNHFDKIECSSEFKEKMKKMLSAEPDGEYADSVRDIEHAPKINYHRWTTVAASFILVAGIGGAVVYNMRNSAGEPVYSNTESSDSAEDVTTAAQKAVELNCEVNFSIRTVTADESKNTSLGSMSDYRFYEKDFGRLPDSVVNEISEKLQNCDWTEAAGNDSGNVNSASVWVDDSEIDYSAPAVILSYTGEENFVCTVSESGYVMIEDGSGKRYCENNLYYDILKFIACNLPYCDWTLIADGETGRVLDSIFKNHADEIVLGGYSNGFILPSEVKKGIGLKFFEDSIFTGYIDENGTIYFRYRNIDEDGIIRHALINFSSSPEIYNEIAEKVNITEEENSDNASEEIFSSIDKFIEGGECLFYKSENPVMLDDDSSNIEMLCDAVKSLEWSEDSSDFTETEYLGIGGIYITGDGKIYNSFNGRSFKAENQDISVLTRVFDELKMLAEYRGFTDSDNSVIAYFADCIKDSTVMSYASGMAQDSKSASFENVNMENLSSAIKSLEWTKTDSVNITGEFFVIGSLKDTSVSFMITRDGKIHNSSDNFIYSAENQDLTAINDALDEIIESSDINYVMYMLASSENRFSTMSGDIYLDYAEDNVNGAGVLYYDNKKHDEYIHIEDIDSSASFFMNEGEWSYSVSGNDGVNLSEKGFRFYDTPVIEYSWLKSAVLSHLRTAVRSEINNFSMTKSENGCSFSLEYTDNGQNITVSANLDSMGNPVQALIENGGTKELFFSAGDSTGGGFVYDSPDFIIPQSSVNYVSGVRNTDNQNMSFNVSDDTGREFVYDSSDTVKSQPSVWSVN